MSKKLTIRRTTFWIAAFTFAQMLPIMFHLFLKNEVPGTGIHAAHLLDLIVQVPLLAVTLGGLLWAIKCEGGLLSDSVARGKTLFAAIASAVVLFEGHGIHFAANSLSTKMHWGNPSAKLLSLTHFYDEQLGHWLLMIGLAGVLITAFTFEWKHENSVECSFLDKVCIVCTAVLSGFASTIVVLEGQSAGLMMLLFSLIMLLAYKKHVGGQRVARYPVGVYLMIMLATSMCVLGFWFARFSGFTEPLSRLLMW